MPAVVKHQPNPICITQQIIAALRKDNQMSFKKWSSAQADQADENSTDKPKDAPATDKPQAEPEKKTTDGSPAQKS